MATLADKLRTDVGLVFLRTEHFAKAFQYVSLIEGRKPIKAIKHEHGSGPDSHQAHKSMTRRATFHFAESVTDGVRLPVEGDSIIETTAGQPDIVWGLADSRAMKLVDGLWSIEFETGILTVQGRNRPPGL